MDTSALKSIGLTDNEITIYLATLELGESSATGIAKRANLARPTTYDCLKSLNEMGLISTVIKNKVKLFQAANPEKIVEIQKERLHKIENLLPELKLKQQMSFESSRISQYEGISGVKNVIDDLLYTKEPIKTFSSTQDLMGKLTYYFPHYITKRIELQIPIKVLTEKTSQSINWKKEGEKSFRELRFFPEDFSLPNAVFLYANKVSMIDLKNDPTGIIIENKDLNETFSKIFDLVWEVSKK